MSARTIAILVPVTSRGRTLRDAGGADVLRVLLPSLLATATWDGHHAYRLYLGYDAGDAFYDAPAAVAALTAAVTRLAGDRPLTLVLRRCEGTAHAPCFVWNQLFAAAHADGCDFFYQLGDDLVLETPGWARDFPAALMLNPVMPGLGVTGPADRAHVDPQGGLDLGVLTQSFVSRLHMEIFGTYYPPAFRNWWSDNWLTEVYRPDGLRPAFHHAVYNTTRWPPRYAIDYDGQALLDREVPIGREHLRRWLAAQAPRPAPQRRCVIAFSLWGDRPRYTTGALRNAELARTIYPGWVCRFYVDRSVPASVVIALAAQPNVEIVVMDGRGGWHGLFWRFLAAADETVDAVLFRDTDSRVSARERAAVDAWLASDRDAHIMRDHPWHTTEILGGMWGVRRGALWNIRSLIAEQEPGSYWQADQEFLRARVLPLIRGSVVVHDEFFERRPFPTPRRGTEFVGATIDEHDRPDATQTAALAEALKPRTSPDRS